MRGVMCSDEEPVSGTNQSPCFWFCKKAGAQWTLRLWTLSPGWWALGCLAKEQGGLTSPLERDEREGGSGEIEEGGKKEKGKK